MKPCRTYLIATALGLSLPNGGLAQAANEGGLRVGLSYGERLQVDDDTTSWRSELQLDVNSVTRVQALSFQFAGGIEKSLEDGFEGAFVDPRLTLNYSAEARNTRLSFTSSFQKTDNDDLSGDTVDTTDLAALSQDSGAREDAALGLSFELGRTAPFGAVFSLNYAQTTFVDTFVTSVTDSETLSGSVQLRFDVTPTMTGFVTYGRSDLDRDTGVDVESEQLDGRVEVAFSQALQGSFNLGLSRVENSGSVTPSTTEEGLVYGANLKLERPNGTLSGALSSSIGETGRRNVLRVDRSLDFQRGGFSAGIGLSRNDDTDKTDPLYDLSYSYTRPRGGFQISLGQSLSTNSVGTETLSSRFNASLTQDLSSLSRLSARLSFSESTQKIPGGTSSDRLTIGFDYSHALNDSWSLTAGSSHSRTRQSGQPASHEDQIYIGLRTTFGWRP